MKARLVAVKDGISRQSTLIKAIDYMLERWEGLTAFLDDGRLEPDTNTVSGRSGRLQSEKRIRCSAATKAAARPGRSCLRF